MLSNAPYSDIQDNKISISSVDLCLDNREVYCHGQLVELTGLEFNLLYLLMKESPSVLSREKIACHIFDKNVFDCEKCINIHISNIRKKLKMVSGVEYIKTKRGKGYNFIV